MSLRFKNCCELVSVKTVHLIKLKKGFLLQKPFIKLRGQGSNLRPSGYEPDELPLLYRAI